MLGEILTGIEISEKQIALHVHLFLYECHKPLEIRKLHGLDGDHRLQAGPRAGVRAGIRVGLGLGMSANAQSCWVPQAIVSQAPGHYHLKLVFLWQSASELGLYCGVAIRQ